jgi:hypothetical protein
MLLNENPILPQFKFQGRDLMSEIREKLTDLGVYQGDDDSPGRSDKMSLKSGNPMSSVNLNKTVISRGKHDVTSISSFYGKV